MKKIKKRYLPDIPHAELPSHLKAGLGESVTIELDTDKPYVHNAEHIKKFPTQKSKDKKQKKWAKKKK